MIIIFLVFISYTSKKLNKTYDTPCREKIFYKLLIENKPNALTLPYSDINYKFRSEPFPKKIYRTWCWKTPSAECGGRPASVKPFEITKQNLPDWEQIIYSDSDTEEFLHYYFGESHKVTIAYNLINPAYGVAKADLLRYLLIYTFGGLYLDMKSCVSGKLPEIPPDKDMIVSTWGSIVPPQYHLFEHGEYQNWYIYARKGAPILADIIERVVQNIFNLHENPSSILTNASIYHASEPISKGIVLATTGPIAFTLAILNSKHKNTVYVSPTINGILTYMCQSESAEGPNHYSKKKDILVYPKQNSFFIPKILSITHHSVSHLKSNVKNHIYYTDFDVKIFSFETATQIIYNFFGEKILKIFNDFKYSYNKYEIWIYCNLYIYGGTYYDYKNNYIKLLSNFDFITPNNWHIVLDDKIDLKNCTIFDIMISTPPSNQILWETLEYIFSNPIPLTKMEYTNFFFNTLNSHCNNNLKLGKNIQNNKWYVNIYKTKNLS
jgi:mannosyltransferase OCH1-like enzyme